MEIGDRCGRLRGLYGISDESMIKNGNVFTYLERALNGGISIFQLRDKESKDTEIKNLVKELQNFCDEKGILFVLNDRFELAQELNVSGVHLGKDECGLFMEKRSSFDGIIGVSCYNNIETAKKFAGMGADYISFGAFFESKTKPHAQRCPIEILEKSAEIQSSVCAIGGVSAHNAHLLKRADMIAVIGELWHGDIEQNAINLIKAFAQS